MCNPPYISSEQTSTVAPDVLKHEPHLALFGGESGDEYYHSLYQTARQWEVPAVVMEVGDHIQAQRVCKIFDRQGIYKTNIWFDSAGQGRVVVAVGSQEWEFLLEKPDYSVPFDMSMIPRQKDYHPGSLLAQFRRQPATSPYIPRAGVGFKGLLPRYKRPRIRLRRYLTRRKIGMIKRSKNKAAEGAPQRSDGVATERQVARRCQNVVGGIDESIPQEETSQRG
jgi:hypothetical protein